MEISIYMYGDILSGNGAKVSGSIKECAFTIAMIALKSPYPIFSMSVNRNITIRNKTGKRLTLEWEPPVEDYGVGPPEYWSELKKEFERVCELKAFA